MSYRDTTYVIFDGDNDMWAYRYMKGWKARENIDFDFEDAHDLNVITDRASEETVKRKLRTRFSNADQVIVLIGDVTKNLYRFVRWEMDVALDLELPIIAVNLNGKRSYDENLCPPILRDECIVHISFKMKIIKYALNNFPAWYAKNNQNVGKINLHYPKSVYEDLDLL